GRPDAAKGRMSQGTRYAGLHKRRDVRAGTNRFDRRKAGDIKFLGRRACRYLRTRVGLLVQQIEGLRRIGFLRVCSFVSRRALAPPPPAKEFFCAVPWGSPPASGPRRANASGLARSRLRLTNSCSTWCSATKTAIDSCIDFGIATPSTT